jgi:hypothetical protein
VSEGKPGHVPQRLWTGSSEPIFSVLPGTVLANCNNPRSENALLWNLLYPRSQPSVSLAALLALSSLWGTATPGEVRDDQLLPFFWGYGLNGSRLKGLDAVLREVDGPGPKTEIDLILLGEKVLITVEAKHTSLFGRCSRYGAMRCPEIHENDSAESSCRYWDTGSGRFADLLGFGSRPEPTSLEVPCNVHYQLARTVMVGYHLAQRLDREFALWIFLPQARWRSVEKTWLDFSERLLDDHIWRSLRVISWEQLQSLPLQ